MYKSKSVSTVATYDIFPGPVGNFINLYRLNQQTRILKRIQKRKELGQIADEDLVLVEYPGLKDLDPKNWKDQDHYAVLGLPKLRHRATLDQIKFAFRRCVLTHHPDKRRRKGEVLGNENDDYYSCITRANEVLGTLESRRAYDSIDPNFDDEIPPQNKKSKKNFFKVFGEVFEMNSRWSLDENVPLLGDEYSTIEEVDAFYNFWYNFNSWREYSYLDEENKEKAEDAYERRWMEKQNKAARATRKKEENQRIRQLVDNSYACDPRIKKYVELEKKKKEDEKAAKAEAIKKANDLKVAEENERKRKIEKEKLKVEEENRKKAAEVKKGKDKEKKMLKKERQILKNFCKTNNYFRECENERIDIMNQVDHLCFSIALLPIQNLNKEINASANQETAQNLVETELKKLRDEVEKEKRKHLENASGKMKNGSATNGTNSKAGKPWSYDDLKVLIKAVNLFPAGTSNRWEVVATYVNTHSSVKSRTGKECLARAKSIKESDLKAEVNSKAFEKFKESHAVETTAKPKNDEISQRFDGPRVWTADEQKLLEQALKTFPSSTTQRWDKITESIPNRTKKECIIRYKELVEMVKAKKAVNQKTK